MSKQEGSGPPPPALDENIQAHIGEQLKKFYNAILTEPMPGKFEELLDELERKERRTADAGADRVIANQIIATEADATGDEGS